MTRTVNQWRVDVLIGENDGLTYAEARLVTDMSSRIVGVGRAMVSPDDYDVPEIGDEVATARALIDLGNKLLDTASDDIEGVTGEPVRLRG
jgi:hypothetical protein